MLLRVCTVIDQRRRQNVVGTPVTDASLTDSDSDSTSVTDSDRTIAIQGADCPTNLYRGRLS